MSTKVVLPVLGESVLEATISRWLYKVGDTVEENEPLVEVTTDKVDTEITAPVSGTVLKLAVDEGVTVDVGAVLAYIGAPDESPDTVPADNGHAPASAATPAPVAATGDNGHAISKAAAPGPAPRDDLGFISPVVRKLAAEHNIDLHAVSGSGRGGRITKKDVLAHLDTRGSAPKPAVATMPTTTAPTRPAPAAAPAALPGDSVRLSGMRKAIAEHMVHSKQTSPHVTTVFEVDMHAVSEHRKANKAAFAQRGVRLTFTAYYVAAAAAALRAFPMVNSSWDDGEQITLHGDANIGVAVSLGDAGLIVPVIRRAQDLSLEGVARAVNDLAERARAKQLKPDEVSGGTFSITNHGVSGSLFATPIINQPQCAILGTGIIEKRVKVINDAIAIRPMCFVSLTFDHRILDGATADYFVAHIKDTLENWA